MKVFAELSRRCAVHLERLRRLRGDRASCSVVRRTEAIALPSLRYVEGKAERPRYRAGSYPTRLKLAESTELFRTFKRSQSPL